jgi:beta-mannosidase
MRSLDLNGTWRLRWSDGQRGRMKDTNRDVTDEARYIDAQVPGEIHLDALNAGWIKEPTVGANCLAARWIEENLWSYRRTFDVPAAALRGRSWLHFEGLDLAAIVVLNGVEIGRHHNAFYPCRIDVTGHLREGQNVLTVHIESGLYHVADKQGEGYVNSPDQLLHKRHWLRKPQYQFTWDWCCRLINVGIFKPVRLEWTDTPCRVDQLVPLVELSPDLKQGTVRARLFVEGLADETRRGRMTVELVEAGISVAADVEIRSGLHPCEATIEIDDPDLWWPAGHGQQDRYTLRVTLAVNGGEIDEREVRIGFRRVRVIQDPHPEGGRFYTLEINGRKIFAKGANWAPAELIYARLTRDRYAKLIDLAREAHFNFFRINAVGLYENDDFFDLCDEQGILVWQEFPFTCSKFPLTDEAFYRDVKKEAVFQIRRLASRPSLVIWCGSNELEWASWDWGYDKDVVLPDYALYHQVLPRLLAEEDPTRFYQPSSPFSPDNLHPNRDDVGNQHPWLVGMHNCDFRDYRQMICRFASEGGTLGPTALPTMLACLPEGQKQVASFAWQIHDNSFSTKEDPGPPDQMIRQWLGLEPRAMSIEEFTYWGGLIQGEALREYCENFRRRMFDSSAAVFWSYNDCWPVTRGWSIVDYYLRRSPSFWAVRRAMAPIHVVIAADGDRIDIFGINDTGEPFSGDLRYGLFQIAGGMPVDFSASVDLPPNASTRIASFENAQWTFPGASAAFAILSREKHIVARNRLFLPFFKDLKWAPAAIRLRRANGRAIFESDTFAWGVCLDLEGETPIADNFFDIYPSIPHAIAWPQSEAPQVLHIGNLTDLPNKHA